jgi:hypothetical protein
MTGGLVAGPGARRPLADTRAHGRSRGRSGRVPAELAPLRIPRWVRYAKEDVFDLCDTLARAERVLLEAGKHDEAGRVAQAFILLESGLARPHGAGGQPTPGSSSMASELTQ